MASVSVGKGSSCCPLALALEEHIPSMCTRRALRRRLRLSGGFLNDILVILADDPSLLVSVALQLASFTSQRLPRASLSLHIFAKQPGHLSLWSLCQPLFPLFSVAVVIAIVLGGHDSHCSRFTPRVVPSSSPAQVLGLLEDAAETMAITVFSFQSRRFQFHPPSLPSRSSRC